MSGKKKKPPRGAGFPPPDDALFDVQQAASMTECTGILPAQIATEAEGESIASLMDIPPARPSSLLRDHAAEDAEPDKKA